MEVLLACSGSMVLLFVMSQKLALPSSVARCGTWLRSASINTRHGKNAREFLEMGLRLLFQNRETILIAILKNVGGTPDQQWTTGILKVPLVLFPLARVQRTWNCPVTYPSANPMPRVRQNAGPGKISNSARAAARLAGCYP
jgi:hypothetical protein